MSDRFRSPRRSRPSSTPKDAGHTPRTRDAALRRLKSANRWLIAASAGLTGLFTALAASAFPGRTEKVRASTGVGVTRATHANSSASKHAHAHHAGSHRARALKAAESAPESFEDESSEAEEGAAQIEAEEGGEFIEGDELEASGEAAGEEATATEEPEATEEVAPEPEVVEETTVSGGS